MELGGLMRISYRLRGDYGQLPHGMILVLKWSRLRCMGTMERGWGLIESAGGHPVFLAVSEGGHPELAAEGIREIGLGAETG